MSLTKVSYAMIYGTPTNVLDYIPLGTDTTAVDCVGWFNSAIADAVATSGKLYIPAGVYKLSSPLTINNATGLTIEGAAAAMTGSVGVTYENNSVLSFDTAAAGTDGIVISNFIGVSIKNIVISQNHSGAGGGKGLFMWGGHDFTLENVKVNQQVGASGIGIQLGNGSGATACFVGRVLNCKVYSAGVSFYAYHTTSITWDSCYQIFGIFQFVETTYSTVINCASEGSSSFAYQLSNCYGMSLISVGAEANALGAIYLTNACTGITITSPVGIVNNSNANASIGDLVHIDNGTTACNSITIINPTSLGPNAATVANIFATPGTGYTDVSGVTGVYLSKGVGGDDTWQKTKLTLSGDGEVQSFTATLVSGWTNVGTPTLAGKFIKKGKLISFNLTITPATSIQAGALARINIPWSAAFGCGCNVTDGNAAAYGSASLGDATIYMQSTGVLTVPLTIVGQFFID